MRMRVEERLPFGAVLDQFHAERGLENFFVIVLVESQMLLELL